jgi:hypothetical protein
MMIYCISSDIIILTNKINYNETQETFTLGQNYSENIRHYNLPFLLHLDIHIPSFYKNNQCTIITDSCQASIFASKTYAWS